MKIKKIKIKLLRDFRGKKTGDIIEWPENQAARLISIGGAEKVEEKKTKKGGK